MAKQQIMAPSPHQQFYREKVVPDLIEKFGYKS